VCGLVGLRSRVSTGEEVRSRIAAAVGLLEHRGPDETRVDAWPAHGVAIGHTRLAIIGDRVTARQPMSRPGVAKVLAYNGEVYNFRDLARRERLAEEASRSDTVTVYELLCRFGPKALETFSGMFALAFLDLERDSLVLARDRFGEKPLYYSYTDNEIAFASELRALRPLLPDGRTEIDPESVALYHMLGSIPSPRTALRGVASVEPGTAVELRGYQPPKVRAYWTLEGVREAGSGADVSLTDVREKLVESVRGCLIADEPVGLFLSGGYDSNAILRTCSSLGASPACALAMTFPEAEYSEYAAAELSARLHGIKLIEAPIEHQAFEEGLPDFFSAMDQPTADGFNTYFVSRAAERTGVRVWLSGVGGDELFGGYPSFERLSWAGTKALRLSPARALSRLAAPLLLRSEIRRARGDFLLRAGDPRRHMYQASRVTIPPRLAARLLEPLGLGGEDEYLRLLDEAMPRVEWTRDGYEAASVLELSTYTRNQLLRDIDDFSMRYSIEIRSPLLNHELAALVLSVPLSMRRQNGQYKPLLSSIVPGGLPEHVLHQPKRGFTFPLAEWLPGILSTEVQRKLVDQLPAHLHPAALDRLMDGWRTGRVHWSVVWQLYAYARWLEQRAC
jgi:asparagine synthase (glutamine-hydrolysing)